MNTASKKKNTSLSRREIAVSRKIKRGEVMRQALSGVKYKDAIRVFGHELIGPVPSSATNAFTVLANYFLNPQVFQGTRLAQFSSLYEKYVFRKLRIHFDSAMPSTATGQYTIAFDKDISDETPPASLIGLRQMMAFQNSGLSAIWDKSVLDVELSDPQDFYYTNTSQSLIGDERLVYQGQFYLMIASQLSNSLAGNFWIEYVIDLYDPQLESNIHVVKYEKVTASNPSTANHAALNLVLSAPTTQVVDQAVSIIQDANANYALKVGPGTYFLNMYGSGLASTANQYIVPDLHIENSANPFVGNGTINQLNQVTTIGSGTAYSSFDSFYSVVVPALATTAYIYFSYVSASAVTTSGGGSYVGINVVAAGGGS